MGSSLLIYSPDLLIPKHFLMLLITAKAQGLIAEFDGFTLCGGSVRLQEVQAEQTLMKPGNLCKARQL